MPQVDESAVGVGYSTIGNEANAADGMASAAAIIAAAQATARAVARTVLVVLLRSTRPCHHVPDATCAIVAHIARFAGRSYAQTMDDVLDAYSRAVISVVERVSPSVANLRVRLRSRSRVREAGGAAVVLTEERLITNAHVVPAETREGWASFPDGREFRFSVVGRDPFSDLAVIAIDGSDLHPASHHGRKGLRPPGLGLPGLQAEATLKTWMTFWMPTRVR